MSAGSQESAVERLRKQAERAIAESQSRKAVEPLLEKLVSIAPDGSEPSLFAHRHLAEYRLEDHPWRALLHLRKCVAASPEDDVVHALMGLSHALLSNFQAAVASYQRALRLAPRNPWYHHNLGHLLDVALDRPEQALQHLELAHRGASASEHEIGASYAHCLARVGRLDEARALARGAVRAEPSNADHRRLLDWIERGAPPADDAPRRTARSASPRATTSARGEERSPSRGRERPSPSTVDEVPERVHGAASRRRVGAEVVKSEESPQDVAASADPGADLVAETFERLMLADGFTPVHVARAKRLWFDYRRYAPGRIPKPSVCAAAIEYTIARLHHIEGVSRASVARRYGVSTSAVADRFDDIQIVLALKPDDPRYVRR